MKPMTKPSIPQSISEQLGTIHTMTFPEQGCTSQVAILHTDKGRSVLKKSIGEQYAAWLKQEAYVLGCLATINGNASTTQLRVPEVYHFLQCQDQDEGLQAWLLMEAIEGDTVYHALTGEHNPAKQNEILFVFGRSLRQLHDTPCPAELQTDKKWLDHILEQAQYNLTHYEVDGSAALLQHLQQNRPTDVQQTLIHGDCTMDNVLIDQGQITGMIDWSGGAWGDPRYDIALAIESIAELPQAEQGYEAFFAGYGERMISDQDYDYFQKGLYEFF
ncbi:phosphotransferase family protein [Paenibacillus wenxiniae]|uniref:Phosphotransferase family protein n=1 Tax=Paenibacillus wenxiniae TaxID=1636843 RepID=A0ABW4RPI9_9BACL